MAIGPKIENAKFISSENIAKSKNTFEITKPKYLLNDLVLTDSTYNEILDSLALSEYSELIFDQWGLGETYRNRKKIGINLYGPPGTGKTMAAHAIADYLKRNILIINYSDIESKYVGETSKNLASVFEVAKNEKAIIFFDEADAILSKRVSEMRHSTDVSVNQTRSVLLMLIDNHDDIIIYATNFMENFDKAFMRRIASHVFMGLPDKNCRVKLFSKLIPEKLPHKIDFEKIAEKFDGISGSDISNAIFLSALHIARNGINCVTNEIIDGKLCEIVKSKEMNFGISKDRIEDREVSEDFAKEQILTAI